MKDKEIIEGIMAALGTEETGESLIAVARAAHRAEMRLALFESRVRDNEWTLEAAYARLNGPGSTPANSNRSWAFTEAPRRAHALDTPINIYRFAGHDTDDYIIRASSSPIERAQWKLIATFQPDGSQSFAAAGEDRVA